jgi:molybdopterin-guanine dinucleotide biosynthesis protein A
MSQRAKRYGRPVAVDAIVLSGGDLETERFHGLGADIDCKAQIPLLGKPMVEWTVQGLRTCPRIGRIVVVGPPGVDTAAVRALGVIVVPEAGGIVENLRAGLDALPGARQILGLSGDLPLVTCDALEDLFLHAPEADVVFPYVERADILRDFPERVWVFSETPDGAFTGCSAALFRPDAVLANWRWVEALLGARRRSPLGLALLIGPSLALKYLLRRLRVADVEKKLSALLHLVGRGYQSRFSELAMDLDKSSDIPLVERVLEQRQARQPDREAAPVP